MNRHSERCLRAAAAGAILLTLTATRTAEAGGPVTPTGDKRGVALLVRMARAYRAVPGVKLRFVGLGTAVLVLRSGVVVAEQLTIGAFIYVSLDGKTTYVEAPSKSCWRRSQGLTLETPGTHFPLSLRLTDVQAPHRVAGGWTVKLTSEDAPGVHDKGEFRISTPSYLLKSVLATTESGKKLAYQVANLSVQPKVPTPRPLC
jgi:hypothetical protein